METINKVTYLDHSGFLIDTPTAILVFDYYMDPAHAVERIVDENPGKPVIFLVSHHHYDHFNRNILSLAGDRDRIYIMSTDIRPFLKPDAKEKGSDAPIRWIKPGEKFNDLPGEVTVQTFGSTDVGVSYLVTLPSGTRIFHAGDFNYWHWQDENTFAQVRRSYNKFVKIMMDVMADVSNIDIVFFPVDPRLGTDFAAGARLFLENIDVKYFFPMHFWGDYKDACDFPNYIPDNTDSFCLHLPGETVELTASHARFLQLV
ncbi:MAG: MBL fold metallo-hydrolase [Muribaculaceae bacterium]|nr:MBL fold metallo-hydrolase [Muribaculaceae bacterium]